MQSVRTFWNRLRSPAKGARAEETVAPTRLVVGLGNPGPKYADTRHNVGFRVVEALAKGAGADWHVDAGLDARVAEATIAGVACLLVEPQTFMNRSGSTLRAAVERWPALDPAQDILVVYDDLDLPTGRIRLRPSGGAGGHRGMADILRELDSDLIPRLRFGVGHPGPSGEVINWVLAPFSAEDEAQVLPTAVARAISAIEATVAEGLTSAMGQFNENR